MIVYFKVLWCECLCSLKAKALTGLSQQFVLHHQAFNSDSLIKVWLFLPSVGSRRLHEGVHVRRRQSVQPAVHPGVLRQLPEELLPCVTWGHAICTTGAPGTVSIFVCALLSLMYSRWFGNVACPHFQFVSVSPLTWFQLNLLAFLSELLSWFEVQRPEFVQPLDALGNHGNIVCICHWI